MTVRLIETNHCEGSCMFYFCYYDIDKCELCDSALYTGDFRSSEGLITRIKGIIHEPVGTLWYDNTVEKKNKKAKKNEKEKKYNPCTLDEAVDFMIEKIHENEKEHPDLLVFFCFYVMKKEDAWQT